MAYNQITRSINLNAGADMTGKMYTAIKVDNTGSAVSAALGDDAIGILQSEAVAGKEVEVAGGFSILKAKIGAAGCTAGDLLKVDTDGTLVTAEATSVSGAAVLASNVVAVALETAVQNQIASVVWNPVGVTPTTKG